jgi:hypothetical protein
MGRTGESKEGNVECPHNVVMIKTKEERLLGDNTILNPGTKVTMGGWRCADCGMKFLPRNMIEDIIRQLRKET